jgi:UDP:flavonoid glycosyltransferase YjiC (YdhE family)
VKPNDQGIPHWLADDALPPPPMNVVIQIVGSRGDVQPFVALGKNLKEKYGHRIRLATHSVFKQFVEENGLEFFNIGGDPSGLMEYSKLAVVNMKPVLN